MTGLMAVQCVVYNELNTVAALQAITVYMLLRLSENDEDATDFDIPLIETMMVFSVPVVVEEYD
jgi:hypothetical protein